MPLTAAGLLPSGTRRLADWRIDETRPARAYVAVLPLLLGLVLAGCARRESSAAPAPKPSPSAPSSARPRLALPEVPRLEVPSLEPGTTITIDGKLEEPAWARAASTGPFVDVGSGRENKRMLVQGSARLLWDAQKLYVGFEVSDKTVHGGFPKDARDPHLWEKDTVEIMADPDGDGDNQDYYELQVNPQNLVFDTQYDGYNSPNGNGRGPFGHEEWSAKLESAVVVHGTLDDDSDQDAGYTVEIAVPWSSFAKAERSPPVSNDTWRMNFYAMQDNGGAAWSPILGQGNFHRASRFGRVRFVGP